MVLDFIYDDAYAFRETPAGILAIVSINGKDGLINTKGVAVLPFKYQAVQSFYEGLAGFRADNDQYGYMNSKGEVVIEPICII